MSVALVMTVRNEPQLLRPNLLYHRRAGVERCYLYDDGCDDGSVDGVRDLDFVRVAPSVAPDALADRPEAARFAALHRTVLPARQCLNALDALDRARAEGLAWLLHVDADELVCLDAHASRPGELRELLENVDAPASQVTFAPYEVCRRRLAYDDVLREETLLTVGTRNARRLCWDPLGRRPFVVRAPLGHRLGKSAVRVDAGLVPRNPHRFVARDGSAPPTVARPYLLHYYAFDVASFVTKFRNLRDPSFEREVHGRRLPRWKIVWRDLVNDERTSGDEVRRYFARWLLQGERAVRRGRRGLRLLGVPLVRPSIVEVTAVRRALDDLRSQQAQ
ncbi:MAG: glycosyltransferase family 2 protein [Thermodesulfobacteriota bacterium]